jgi:hypothetical protein
VKFNYDRIRPGVPRCGDPVPPVTAAMMSPPKDIVVDCSMDPSGKSRLPRHWCIASVTCTQRLTNRPTTWAPDTSRRVLSKKHGVARACGTPRRRGHRVEHLRRLDQTNGVADSDGAVDRAVSSNTWVLAVSTVVPNTATIDEHIGGR